MNDIKFLTTAGLNNSIEEIFKNAKEFIYIISPFIKIHKRLLNILKRKKDEGVQVIIVSREKEGGDFANQVFVRKNLHAKCYINEKVALLTSLNLYQFSQINNDEMGIEVHINNNLYKEILAEVKDNYLESAINSLPFQKGGSLPVEKGRKYFFNELHKIFDFDYDKPSGIKKSKKFPQYLVLFSSKHSHYDDKKEKGIILYQGQDTGEEEQALILGNKDLYDIYEGKENKTILYFEDYIFKGVVKIIKKPYKENGKWIFPLAFIG